MLSRSRLLRSALPAALLTLAAGGSAGCAASSEYMVKMKGARTGIERSPDAATVVFVRPSSYAAALGCTVLDGNGRYLGDALPSSYFAVKVRPGSHVFIAWAENTAALRATVEAGKIYFVEVSSKMGMFTARMHLLAIAPGTDSWKKVDEWLAESEAYAPDEPRGQAYLKKRAADTGERIDRANKILSEYSPSELAERTLTPTDGR